MLGDMCDDMVVMFCVFGMLVDLMGLDVEVVFIIVFD